jgi:hypothetical protein
MIALFLTAIIALPWTAPATTDLFRHTTDGLRRSRDGQQAAAATIREIRVHGNVTLSDADVVNLAGISVGSPLTDDTADAVARRLKASGLFDDVDVRTRYRTLDMSEAALVLVVHEKSGTAPDGTPPTILGRLRRQTMFFPILRYDDGYGWTYGLRTSVVGAPGSPLRVSAPLSWGATRRAAVEIERTFDAGPLTRLTGSYGIAQRDNPHFNVADRRVEVNVRAGRPSRVANAAERHVAGRGIGAEDHPAEQPPLGTHGSLDAPIVHAEVRVFLLRDAIRSGEPRERAGIERPLDFDRCPACAAPRERHRDPHRRVWRADDARAQSVRPPISIVVVHDRQEHQPAAQPTHDAGRMTLALHRSRLLVDDEHERRL